jgi:hypothetical protein
VPHAASAISTNLVWSLNTQDVTNAPVKHREWHCTVHIEITPVFPRRNLTQQPAFHLLPFVLLHLHPYRYVAHVNVHL